MGDMADEFGVPANIKISMDTGANPALFLTIEPRGRPGDILTLKKLEGVLEANGATDWFIDKEQIRLIREEQLSLTSPKTYRIAERRDAQVQARMSNDRKEARITVLPAYGGEPVSREKILAALKSAGVAYGILETKIPDLVARGSCEDELIAEAAPPMPGTDVLFERLFNESEHKGRPKVEEGGRVDLHDLGLFVSVAKGTPLLRRIPPTPGMPGVAVDGDLIPPRKPRDQNLNPGTGTEISREDPNILIAAAGGLPVITDNSVKIVSKLELDGLDYETGNVEFVGSLLIRGSIQPGFNAKAGGDVVVVDTVDASNLTAAGSIQLRCGVFGRGRSQISAQGDIKARFLSDCTVYCGGNLEVDDLIANCTVVCEGVVEVGQRWGKGQIYGGRVIATRGIRAKILGSVMEMNTVIEISPSPTLASRERTVISEIADLEHKAGELGRSFAYLQCSATNRKDPRLERFAKEYQDVRAMLESLKVELADLSAKLQVGFDARISASQVFPGVTVSIGKKREVITAPLEFFVFEPTPEWDLPMTAEMAPGRGSSRNRPGDS